MASVPERLSEVVDQLSEVEHKWLDQGVPDTIVHKISMWRDVCLEAVYALNTGRHRAAPTNGPDPMVIGTQAMEQKLRDLRWELTPREYQEFVQRGALYTSIMESILAALTQHGYDIVKRG